MVKKPQKWFILDAFFNNTMAWWKLALGQVLEQLCVFPSMSMPEALEADHTVSAVEVKFVEGLDVLLAL